MNRGVLRNITLDIDEKTLYLIRDRDPKFLQLIKTCKFKN
jgi:hypothetical protein